MRIVVDTIAHHRQRYPTAGDWKPEGRSLVVKVSALGDERMELLVALHEIVEAVLCEARGIPEPDVMLWDLNHPGDDDPGALPGAPYHREHMFAEKIERMVADELGVNWAEYGKAIEALFG